VPYKYTKGLELDASKEERQKFRKELSDFVNTKLSNLDGFVLFDDNNRYQINLPKGW
jgi:hypothetical protein